MARANRVLGAISVAAVALSLWLYVDNRALRAELADRSVARSQPAAAAPSSSIAAPAAPLPAPPPSTPTVSSAQPPALPEAPRETRMERRARRTEEIAAMLGRIDGESEDDYKARIQPLLTAGLAIPRARVDEQRKVAEEKAQVTPEQSAKLDRAFDKIYSDVIEYTNKAVTDGQLSPYERNVSGWLEYAGGLGAILHDANGQVGKILAPAQLKAMSDAGFEWGEYLGVKAPWEQLKAPPPRAAP